MDLLFKYWLEDCGEVLSTYSNVNDEGFARKKIASHRTGGRAKPDKSNKDKIDQLFKKGSK